MRYLSLQEVISLHSLLISQSEGSLVFETAAVLIPISYWIRYLCGIQLADDKRGNENDNQTRGA